MRGTTQQSIHDLQTGLTSLGPSVDFFGFQETTDDREWPRLEAASGSAPEAKRSKNGQLQREVQTLRQGQQQMKTCLKVVGCVQIARRSCSTIKKTLSNNYHPPLSPITMASSPRSFLLNRRSITVTLLQDESAALHWPTNVADVCRSALVSSLVYGAPVHRRHRTRAHSGIKLS